MKNKKSNTGLYVVIVILGILVLFLGGYIVYDKVFENDAQINNNNNNESSSNNEILDNDTSVNQNQDTNNYTNWMDYIMSTNINSIKLGYCVSVISNGNEVPTLNEIDINRNDLNRIFSEMKKGSIAKNYNRGLGGPCMPSVKIGYTNSDQQYELSLIIYRIIDPEYTNDQKILSYLENTNYTINTYNDNIDLNTEPYMFDYTYNQEVIETIINEYTK